MKGKYQNEGGMTLVELLAALVLLGIILVAFMSFFTQSANFTAHNHETLTAVQVAEEVVADVRDLSEIRSLKDQKDYKLVSNYIEDRTTHEQYIITLTEEIIEVPRQDDPTKKLVLKKAIISVKSRSGYGINEPEFKTEMYLKR
ncbi:prepilin-type N-terminal cleavage/methylation domain-containing protein [Planococcus shenhongbingii]|uniref:prepilin-type N-terminal cleavage/methylation domain-containing protein n=1 Tax=Planococcus shenhongbingii TaxID=3058398 RepID=UPI0026132805|nr:prepilin-type N-terminal cleavage/methylation domain-containing protein [Planococcus sp. N016]WKA59925.1 prepilin-type N-terminal cleavage/methylation domain-containing protein [Planococcus sp. N016]